MKQQYLVQRSHELPEDNLLCCCVLLQWRIMFWYEGRRRLVYLLSYECPPLADGDSMMMQRDAPKTIFGRPVYQDEHHSDIVRLEAVMKYGGIYHDLDVVVLQPLGKLYCYKTTMGEELPNWLCNGFFMSVANATFLSLWYESYRTFQSHQWNYHSVLMPCIIVREHPGLVHVEKDTIHKPNWEDFGLRKLYNDGTFYNWTARNYAVHLWYRFHNVDYDPESIKRLNKTVGQIFRYIFYEQSDMIR